MANKYLPFMDLKKIHLINDMLPCFNKDGSKMSCSNDSYKISFLDSIEKITNIIENCDLNINELPIMLLIEKIIFQFVKLRKINL